MATQMKIVALFEARPGKNEQLRKLLNSMLAPSRAEPGNVRYDLWQDQEASNRFVLDELYVDADAVAAHRETPHFQAYIKIVDELAVRSAHLLDPAAVA
jgi:quinol monooxygenase YgiN